MIFKQRGLAFKQSVYILSAAALIFIAIFSYAVYESTSMTLDGMEKQAKGFAESAANKLDQTFMVAMRSAQQTAIMLENGSYTSQEIETLMKTTMLSLKDQPEIYGTGIAFAPGAFDSERKYFMPYVYHKNSKIIFSYLGDEKYQYFYHPWYYLPKELNKPVWTEPYYDEGGGNTLMTTYAVPFYKTVDGKKTFMGVVTMDLSLFWLQRQIAPMKMFNSGYAFVVSRFGRIVTHPDAPMIMNETIFSIADSMQNPKLREVGRKMIAGEGGFAPFVSTFLGRECWLYYTPLKANDWSLAIVMPDDELFAHLLKVELKVVFMALAGFIMILIVVIVITLRITKPLRKLTSAAKQIGQGNFQAPVPEINENDEIGVLSKSFSSMQSALVEYIENLEKTTAAKNRIESELNIARDIQMSILPQMFPPFPERREFKLYAILESARAVGGDLYDFFFIDKNHLCFVVGDVSGKGVPASLFMAVTHTLLRGIAEKSLSAGEMVSKVSKSLAHNNDMMMFVTYFLGILNIKTGEIEFTNAGHNPPYIINPDGSIKRLSERHGPPIAISETVYNSSVITLQPGASILIYTDGVTEAMNMQNQQFEERRLIEVITRITSDNPHDYIEALNSAVKVFAGDQEQSDDITILGITYDGNAAD